MMNMSMSVVIPKQSNPKGPILTKVRFDKAQFAFTVYNNTAILPRLGLEPLLCCVELITVYIRYCKQSSSVYM